MKETFLPVIECTIHEVNEVRHTKIYTPEPLMTEPYAFEVELVIGNLESHKSLGSDQIPAEIIKARGRKIRYEIYKLIISIWNKEEFPEE